MFTGRLQGRSHKVLLPLLFILRAAILRTMPAVSRRSEQLLPGSPCRWEWSTRALRPWSLTHRAAPFTLFDLGLSLRWPIPPLPVLQPAAAAGMMQFRQPEPERAAEVGPHRLYGELGLGVRPAVREVLRGRGRGARRASRSPATTTWSPRLPRRWGYPNLLFEAGARIIARPLLQLHDRDPPQREIPAVPGGVEGLRRLHLRHRLHRQLPLRPGPGCPAGADPGHPIRESEHPERLRGHAELVCQQPHRHA